MRKLRIFASSLMLIVASSAIQAQEKLGVITDNYLPVNQMLNNPSAIVDQKPWISINVAGAHAFMRNNFLYFRNSRLWFNTNLSDPTFEAPNRNGWGFLQAEVMGPSASISWKEQSFGFHTAVRSYTNVNRIPAVLGEIVSDESVENIEDGTYQMSNGRAKTLSWAEVGLSYGRIFYKRGNVMINGGGTLKRIIGIQQSSLIVRDAEVEVTNGSGVLRNLDGRYSYSDPNWAAGSGWAASAGVTYKKMLDNVEGHVPHSTRGGCKTPQYRYKLGVSLLDLGYARFRQSSRTASLSDTVTVNDLEDVDNNTLGTERNRFTAALPSAVSAQFDYFLEQDKLIFDFYVNAMLVQKLSIPRTFGAERANVLAVTPRMESSWFSAAIPLSLSNYTVPQVGLYLRFGPLAIGSDHVTPFIMRQNIRAADLYVYLNIPIKKSPECRDRDAKGAGKWFCPVW